MGLFERWVDSDWVYRKARDFKADHSRKKNEEDEEEKKDLGTRVSNAAQKAKAENDFIRSATTVNEEAFRAIKKGTWYCVILLFFFAALCGVNHFICYGTVSGNSMMNTYENGDMFVAIRNADIEKGDVIVFTWDDEVLIKRVIATEGDVVRIEDGVVRVNGLPIEEKYAVGDSGDMQRTEIGEGMIFVMGDNREHSYDSRKFGAISLENVIGKVVTGQ